MLSRNRETHVSLAGCRLSRFKIIDAVDLVTLAPRGQGQRHSYLRSVAGVDGIDFGLGCTKSIRTATRPLSSPTSCASAAAFKGTERPFANKYDKHFKPGTYACAACGQELFGSKTEFNSSSQNRNDLAETSRLDPSIRTAAATG